MPSINLIVALSNLFCGLIVIGVSLPLVKGKVPMNRLYGVRFKRSFESDELWYEINRFGGRKMIRWSIVLLALGVISLVTPPPVTIVLGFGPLLLLIPCLESHRYAKSL